MSKRKRRQISCLPIGLFTIFVAGCVSAPLAPDGSVTRSEVATRSLSTKRSLETATNARAAPFKPVQNPIGLKKYPQVLNPLPPGPARQTGSLKNPALRELSGLAAAQRTPGALFAVNDSGNSPTLYMLDERGRDLAQWPIGVPNRDWEDMATAKIDGKPYLIIGDTGDNRQRRKKSLLYLFAEPDMGDVNKQRPLQPAITIRFSYEDGPRNVESIAVTDNTVYLISKENPTAKGATASRLYTLPLSQSSATLSDAQATFVTTLPQGRFSVEAKLASALAGVDLNHPTALVFDDAASAAYILTYLDVLKVYREPNQTWAEAFAEPAERLYTHQLQQAESMAITRQALWLSSENAHAPIWALPLSPTSHPPSPTKTQTETPAPAPL